MLEQLLHQPLIQLENNNLINSCQNGFRPKRSTTQTVFEYTSDLYKNLNCSYETTAVYVNFRKAFDTVSHKILLNKLKTFGIGKKYQEILQNCLSDRHQRTLLNNVLSDQKPVPYVVSQGSILGPTLFLLYINDVVNNIENCSCYLYADDMVIYKPLNEPDSLRHLQNDINRVYDWCNKNKLTINIETTKAQISPINTNADLQLLHLNNPITINNTKLQYEPTFRYLGINIDQHLSMKSMCDTIYRNASHKLYIYRLVRGSLTASAATQVLRAMFISVLDYRNFFLTGVNRNNLSDLQKLQNDAKRCCLEIKQPRDVHVNDLHQRLNVHLLDHRRIVHLLTCVKMSVANKLLPHIKTDEAVLRNQGLKIILSIPLNDTVKKSPFYWGSMLWNCLPLHVREIDDILLFKKNDIPHANEWDAENGLYSMTSTPT